MQKLINNSIFSFVILLLSLLTPSLVSAHILQSNGSVGAVMHVTPDDDPVAGEQSDFFFEFKDKEGRFQPAQCNCTFTVLQSGKEIFSQALFTNNTDPSLKNASVSFVFPQKDVYVIQIVGRPKSTNAFSEFSLTYDIRVERTAEENVENQTTNAQTGNKNWILTHIPHILVGTFSIVLLLYLITSNAKKRKT